MGTMGPSLVPLANRHSPRAPMGPNPKASHPRNAQATLRPGAQTPLIPNASFPDLKANRPRNTQATLHPSARAPLVPDASFPGPKATSPGTPGRLLSLTPPFQMRPGARMPLHPDASFPDRQLHQQKLPTGSL